MISQNFYVQLPLDEYWNTSFHWQVIQAEEMPPKEDGVFLKVITPSDFIWERVRKSEFIVCPGPVRKLDYLTYVQFMHTLRPDLPLPEEVRKFLES